MAMAWLAGGPGLHDAAEPMALTVVPTSSGNTLRQTLLLQDFRPQGLACTPSFALHIGESMREQGIDPRALGVAYGLFGAEPWTEAMRAQLEALWGCVAVDFYGLSEMIGPGVATECAGGRDGLHVNEDHFLPEIVDPRTGASLPDGQEGELVLTTLTREALPMVRYPTRDAPPAQPGPRRRRRAPPRPPVPLRPHRGAHGPHQGAHRRHADHQGRQRLPVPAGGRAAHPRGRGPALPAAGGPAGVVSHPRGPRGAG